MNFRRAILMSALAFCVSAGAGPRSSDSTATWVPAWYSPTFPPTANLIYNDVRVFDHQTVRQVIRLEASGNRMRLRLGNELGLSAVKFGAIHIAHSSPNGVIIDPKSDRPVTFGGNAGGEIALGGSLVSDPVDLPVNAFDYLAVSIYYPGRLAPSGHLLQQRISKPGDHTADIVMPFTEVARSPSIIAGIEVETAPRNVIVAFGDSITEGAGATPGWNLSWPQQLSQRLAKTRQGKSWTIINAGISGNRLLYDGAGQRGLDRFSRDALNIPGLKAIVLLEGVNDIGAGSTIDSDTGPRSAEDIIGAYKQLIAGAHAKNIKIYGGTILPYSGATYFSAAGEATRQAVNAWIRSSGAFDGVVDFDAVMRDPAAPSQLIGAFQSGDNLHPNDAGYTAMANAVDLNVITSASKTSRR